jgi:5-hydroxyisourate hydrolase
MSGISTHILDTSVGRPAAGIEVSLECRAHTGLTWVMLAHAVTDQDGRCRQLLTAEQVARGVHRLRFRTGAYFAARGQATLYPEIAISFEVTEPGAGYHIPLLLNPFGYSTYRGS